MTLAGWIFILSSRSARCAGVGGRPGFGSRLPASRIPAQLMKYEKSLWYTTIGTPLSGAACCSQRASAACQRPRNAFARERLRDPGDIARIGVDVRIAPGMEIAERAVEDFRDSQLDDVLRGFEVTRAA